MQNLVLYNNNEVNPSNIAGLRVHFTGNNSRLEIAEGTHFTNSEFLIGEECSISIGSNCCIQGLTVNMSGGGENKTLKIGNKFAISSGFFAFVNETHTHIVIGDNCLFGSGITMRGTDGHIIYDVKTKAILNKARQTTVCDHVWVCANVTILKNSFVARDCVIGTNTTLSGKFTQPNTVICGNPARVVREGINWDHAHII